MVQVLDSFEGLGLVLRRVATSQPQLRNRKPMPDRIAGSSSITSTRIPATSGTRARRLLIGSGLCRRLGESGRWNSVPLPARDFSCTCDGQQFSQPLHGGQAQAQATTGRYHGSSIRHGRSRGRTRRKRARRFRRDAAPVSHTSTRTMPCRRRRAPTSTPPALGVAQGVADEVVDVCQPSMLRSLRTHARSSDAPQAQLVLLGDHAEIAADFVEQPGPAEIR